MNGEDGKDNRFLGGGNVWVATTLGAEEAVGNGAIVGAFVGVGGMGVGVTGVEFGVGVGCGLIPGCVRLTTNARLFP